MKELNSVLQRADVLIVRDRSNKTLQYSLGLDTLRGVSVRVAEFEIRTDNGMEVFHVGGAAGIQREVRMDVDSFKAFINVHKKHGVIVFSRSNHSTNSIRLTLFFPQTESARAKAFELARNFLDD